MKNIKGVTVKDTELLSASNEVSIAEAGCNKQFKVQIVDESGTPITQYKDVKENIHKVVIVMKFQGETDSFAETSSNNVIYYLKNSDNGKIDKKQTITVKAGQRGELQKAIKETHKKLLKKKFPEELSEPKKDITGTDLQYIIGDNAEGNINVIVSSKSVDPTNTIHFNGDKVKLETKYVMNKEIGFDDAITINEEFAEKKSKLTTGWIVFFVMLAAAIILIIVFGKEIWRGIRGERKQEKKVREQIDIF